MVGSGGAAPRPGAAQGVHEASETWTTRRLLAWLRQRFERGGIDSPRVVAEMLLAHVIACERVHLYMEADRPASADELERLRALVQRADRAEPVQYLVGQASFYGREFEVTRDVFIPQPCTEELIGAVRERFAGRARGAAVSGEAEACDAASPRPEGGEGRQATGALRVADIGTGSGCIAISLACHVPDAQIVATDISSEALAVARRNAARHRVAQRVELRAGFLLEPLERDAPFDAIVSNPPYIPDHEWEGGLVDRAVKEHVPALALRGGPDGLDLIRPLVAGAAELLVPGGLLAIEIADCQRDAAAGLAEASGFEEVTVLRDGEGFWRVLVAVRRGGGLPREAS